MKFKINIILVFFLLMFAGCQSKDKTAGEVEGSNLKNIELVTTDDKPLKIAISQDGLSIKGYENKIILLDFFATWCPPCKAEIPHLNALKEKYPNLEIIGVLLEKNKSSDEIEKFKKQFKIKYNITNSNENYILSDELGGISTIPTMFLFASDGSFIQKYVGLVPQEMLASDIDMISKK